MKRRHLLVLSALAVLGGCGSDGEPPKDPPPSPALPAGVYALAGLSPTLPYTDLEPLRRIVGEKDLLLVDLREPLPESLLPPGGTYRVGQEWGDPYRQFAALLFLEHSPPMAYVPAGSP